MKPDTLARMTKGEPNPFKVGDTVMCVDGLGAYNVAEYEVYAVENVVSSDIIVRDGEGRVQHLSLFHGRFRACEKPLLGSDLNRLRTILRRAGTRFASWHIDEYVDRAGKCVKAEGWTLTFGSRDGGPYTEFLFNQNGNIMTDGAKSVYARPPMLEME